MKDAAMLVLVPKTNKQGKMFSLGNKWPQVQEQFHCSQKFCSYSKTSNKMVEKYSAFFSSSRTLAVFCKNSYEVTGGKTMKFKNRIYHPKASQIPGISSAQAECPRPMLLIPGGE